MPMYKLKQNIVLKKARILSETGICLPSSPSLKEKDIKYICEQIEKNLIRINTLNKLFQIFQINI